MECLTQDTKNCLRARDPVLVPIILFLTIMTSHVRGENAAKVPEELAKQLDDKDSNVRIAAAKEIAKLGAEGKLAARALVRNLRSQDPKFLEVVKDALVALGPPNSSPRGCFDASAFK